MRNALRDRIVTFEKLTSMLSEAYARALYLLESPKSIL